MHFRCRAVAYTDLGGLFQRLSNHDPMDSCHHICAIISGMFGVLGNGSKKASSNTRRINKPPVLLTIVPH